MKRGILEPTFVNTDNRAQMRLSFQEKKVGIMQDFWRQKGQLAEIGDASTDSKIEKTLSGFNDFYPIGRVGRPRDVALVIDFLLSKESS